MKGMVTAAVRSSSRHPSRPSAVHGGNPARGGRDGDGMVEGVIPEQLDGQVVPDWPGAEFRLLRERSEQNRMHMPEGDYHRLYWWSRALGGGNGRGSCSQQETPAAP